MRFSRTAERVGEVFVVPVIANFSATVVKPCALSWKQDGVAVVHIHDVVEGTVGGGTLSRIGDGDIYGGVPYYIVDIEGGIVRGTVDGVALQQRLLTCVLIPIDIIRCWNIG